ncbi:cytochrome P450 [Hypoxylon trugodes]|uniref:cytochrome P450 n=1 Tax=Hypoxylon trugodes TaxID=326681 RepID=UPI00218D42B3|nr:cytochrome P450 [Hypoxylon trugodes]KAI1387218.1 cytochrome P450 [Hypoxylon trugodes]
MYITLTPHYASLLTCKVFTICVYRLVFHPLKDYPGPWIAKVTDLYGVFIALGTKEHFVTRENHLKYGPVIRQGPNRLVFNSAKALHESSEATARLARATNVWNAADKRLHRSRRRLVGETVSERSMRRFEPVMTEQIDIFIKQILDSARSPNVETNIVNMTHRIKRLSFDIVSRLAFGYPLDSQTKQTYRFIMEALNAGTQINYVSLQLPSIALLQPFLFAGIFNYGRLRDYHEMVTKMISSRLSKDVKSIHDLYSVIANEIDTETDDEIGSNDLWAEAVFFFPAGGDTVSTGLCALLFYLSRNPESYEKLAKEIRTAFTNADEIQGGQKLTGCRYLRACIDEALRLSPPLAGALWRELPVSDKETEPLIVDGHVIPPGTQIGVSTYTLHHNEDYFPDPFAFQPERWLALEDETERKQAHNAFAAFSLGSRGCAGKAMAYLESSLVVAKTLWYFDFESAPGSLGKVGTTPNATGADEFQLLNVFTSSHDGPNLIFHPRGDSWRELQA